MKHLLLNLLLLPLYLYAQEAKPLSEHTTDAWQEIYAGLMDLDDFDEDGWQEAYEILTAMAEDPQNINETTLEDLLQIPLLTERQAIALLNYRSLYGDLHSMSELAMISQLDRPRITLLNALFFAKPTKGNGRDALVATNDSLRQAMKDRNTEGNVMGHWRKNERHGGSLLFTMTVPTYERAGYRDGTYQGGTLNHSLRFSLQKRHYQIGLTAAQDAGEPFFSGTNAKGWDFYTGFVRLKDIGVLRNFVVGHYQMSMGMGLILNNNYRLSRSSLLISSPSASTVLRGHSSRQESNYLQGIAATIAFPHSHSSAGTLRPTTALTVFASYRGLDATISKAEPPTITTLLTTGYHRTQSEIDRRNSTYQAVAGASLSLDVLPFRLALNVVHVTLSDSLLPDKRQQYRMFLPTGKHFTNGSLAYSYITPRLQFSGETAISEKATGNEGIAISNEGKTTGSEEITISNEGKASGVAVATINSINWRPRDSWTLFAVQRFYSYRYQSLMAKSFGDVSNAQNETGVYAGITTTSIRHLSLSAYIDCAYHPWYRYGYNGASRSWDTYAQATYTRNNMTATIRYRYREQAISSDGTALPAFNGNFDGTAQHSLRGTIKIVKGRWTTTSQVQGTYLPTSSDWGFLVSQGAGYTVGMASLWASLTYFKTSDYASRLYMTDRTITYGSMSSMVYGEGFRINILGQIKATKNLTISLRGNTLCYFDRNKISSGHQLIDSSSQTDIQLQVGWKF